MASFPENSPAHAGGGAITVAGDFVDNVLVRRVGDLRSSPALAGQVENLGGFNIVIVAGPGLAANPAALAAFERAATSWEARISDSITVTINADLASLGPGILGSTSSVALQAGYSVIRDEVVADAADETDDGIGASIPTSAQFTAALPSGFTLDGNLVASKANLKALGFTGLDTTFGVSDGDITFSTDFTFDYDRSDGVTAGQTDFETVAAHEIGHLLGFFSEVDSINAIPAQAIGFTTLDLFRFRNGTNDPATAAEFTTFPRNFVPGVDTIFDEVSTDPLNPERRMSTGLTNAAFAGTDGRQASHWKADELTGVYIGLMDPTLSNGVFFPPAESDFRALDLIGYDIAPLSADYLITTAGGVMTVTDASGNGDTLAISEPAGGSIQFAATGRTFSLNGAPSTTGDSGPIPLAGTTSIVVNGAGGADTINVGAFTANPPSLTVNGGPGDDTVNFNGDLTFAANAGLDVNLQNDDATPGLDTVALLANANVLVSGAGIARVECSGSLALASGSSLETVNGNLTVAANQQAISTATVFDGVLVSGGTIRSTGTGEVSVAGTGGAGGGVGVRVQSGGAISSHDANTSVTGRGGSGGAFSSGVVVQLGSISATGSGSLVIEGEPRGASGPAVHGLDFGSGGTAASLSVAGVGTITLIGDSLSIDPAAAIQSGGTVIIRQRTNGQAIDLGSITGPTAGVLELSNAELGRITCGTLGIGDASSGALTASASIARGATTNFVLTSGTDILLEAGPLDSAGGNVTLNPGGANSTITPVASGTDVAMGSTGTVSFGSGDALAFAVDGPAVDTGYQQLKVTGKIDLTGVLLALDGAYVPQALNLFTLLDNDGSDLVTGTFTGLAEGASVMFNGVPLVLSYIGGDGNDVTLASPQPAVGADSATVMTNEGTPAVNTGTFGDLQGNATVTLSADVGIVVQDDLTGTWSWSAAAPDGAGSQSVTITATDSSLFTASTTFNVTINNVAPSISASGAASVNEGSTYTLQFSGITDPGQDTVTSATINWGDGSAPSTFLGNPANENVTHVYADGPGAYTISFTITDEDGTFAGANTVGVSVLNAAPVGVAQIGANAVPATEDAGAVTITLAATDPGPIDNSVLNSFQVVAGSVSPAGAGTVQALGGNQASFTPAADFFGTASFQFTATDKDGGVSSPATVEVAVAPVNDAIVATNDTLSAVNEDSGVRVISFAALTGNDDAGPLESAQGKTVIAVNSAVGGSVAINGGNVEFTPTADFNGAASFSYTVQDDGQTGAPPVDDFKTASATASFTINAVNDVPSFTKGADITVLEDAGPQSVPGWATAISAGPANESGQALNFIVTADQPALFATPPAVAADGTLTFTWAEDGSGSASVTVALHDDGGGNDTSATQTFTISTTAVNDAPTFVAGPGIDTAHDAGPQSFTAWAKNISPGPGEGSQTVTFLVQVDKPELFATLPTITANGTLAYAPLPAASGVAVLTIRLQDNGGTADGSSDTSGPQTVEIAVTSVVEESGSYVGLVQPPAGGPRENARTGTVQFKVVAGGAFSGKLNLAGLTVRMKGVIKHDGSARFGKTLTPTLIVQRKNQARLELVLNVEVARGTNTFTGSLGPNTFAVVAGDRALYTSKRTPVAPLENVPPALLGNYTVILPALTPAEQGRAASTFPQGDGYGKLTVSTKGIAKLSGTLADGSKISSSGPIAKSGRLAVYRAFGKTGSISGFATFRDVADLSDVDASDLLWFHTASVRATRYPNGWPSGIFIDLAGAKYTAPTRKAPGPVLPGLPAADGDGNAELTLSDGGLTMANVVALSIGTDNRPTVLTTPGPTFTLAAKTGIFKGKFTHPATGRKIAYGGVVLQKRKIGAGYFLSLTEGGAAVLVPDAQPGVP